MSAEHPRTLIYPLLAERPNGRFSTHARLLAVPSTDPHFLQMKVAFDPDFDGVSLAYNLYAVQVLIDGVPTYFEDLTRGCRSFGASIFPGGEIRLPVIKLIGDGPQRLQIMVWGKL
ncbi:MAG: hypothetical protein KF799_04410 [Bdellovibrionales bacterium]|nr:hypothetical protein [Bdellovibrionales bacterium]